MGGRAGKRDLSVVFRRSSRSGTWGWSWVLITYDVEITSGWEETRSLARLSAAAARRIYLNRLCPRRFRRPCKGGIE